MATAAVQTPSYNRVEPGSNQLRPAAYPQSNAPPKADVHRIASDWAESLKQALSSQDYERLKQLFLPGSCWRDQLALSWDYHTLNGPEKIIQFLKSSPHGCRIKSIDIDDSSTLHSPHVSAVDFNGQVNGVGSFLNVETDVGKGPGIVRLLQDQQDGEKWKAFTLFTAMHELKGHKETVRGNRYVHFGVIPSCLVANLVTQPLPTHNLGFSPLVLYRTLGRKTKNSSKHLLLPPNLSH